MSRSAPDSLFVAAAAVQELCREREWTFCFLGGLAVMRWSGHRLTNDIDLTILTGHGDEAAVADGLLERFEPRYGYSRRFAWQTRLVQAWAPNRVPVDVALGASRRLRRTMNRASLWDVGVARLLTCSAEDLVLYKALAGRDQDWRDIAGVTARQAGKLDGDLILREVALVVAQGNDMWDPLVNLNRRVSAAAIGHLRELLGMARAG